MKRYDLPKIGGTKTTEGFIPYAKHPSGIECPVKIAVIRPDQLPAPLRDKKWRLIYALPGGGEWVANDLPISTHA